MYEIGVEDNFINMMEDRRRAKLAKGKAPPVGMIEKPMSEMRSENASNSFMD